MSRGIRIIGAAFGNPRSERSFSGVPKHLFGVLAQRNLIVASLSTRQLRWWDLFNNAVDLSKIRKYGRPGINYRWLWRRKTVQKLSARFQKKLNNFTNFNTVLQIGTHIFVCKPGVEHYCFTDMTVAQAARAGQFLGPKFLPIQISEAIEVQKDIFNNCKAIFVSCHWVKDSIVQDYSVTPQKVHVVGEGASVSSKSNSVYCKRLRHNIIFIGRDWHRKGGPLLLDAFFKIKKEIRDATLTIVGCTPRVIDSSIKVLGPLDKTNEEENRIFQEALSNASVLCVPSIFEPFGIVFLEAQLYKIPVVTFWGQGRMDAIIDGETGILVKDRNSDALSESLLELLTNPQKADRMGNAGYDFVLQNFTWDRVAHKILSVMSNNQ
jgi:glycosyltransferase involved in cell wall biosynthesis